jgi:hypothetical protein
MSDLMALVLSTMDSSLIYGGDAVRHRMILNSYDCAAAAVNGELQEEDQSP